MCAFFPLFFGGLGLGLGTLVLTTRLQYDIVMAHSEHCSLMIVYAQSDVDMRAACI